jgi:hypothetical protein
LEIKKQIISFYITNDDDVKLKELMEFLERDSKSDVVRFLIRQEYKKICNELS